MGNNLGKEVAEACKTFDLNRLQEIFNSDDGENFDVFEIIDTPEFAGNDQLDCLSLLLKYRDRSLSLMPYFELIKKQIDKVNSKKNESSKCKPQLEKHNYTYLERLLENGNASIEEFNFFIDNSDIFPLKAENDPDCPIILHLLASNRDSLPLLQDYLSSGKVDEVFKNSNNDGEKMRHSYKYNKQTPLQIACGNINVEAVRELVVNNIGGKNYTQVIEEIIANTDVALKHEDAAVDICLCLLSQSNADSIRNHVMPTTTTTWLNNGKRARLLRIVIEREEKDDEIQLATAAFIVGLDKLRAALLSNGCLKQKKMLKSSGLVSDAEHGRAAEVKEILVDLKAHEICIDINRGSPLVAAATHRHVEIVKMLLEETTGGCCDVNQQGIIGSTALHACCRARNEDRKDKDASSEKRMAILELLINAGVNLNALNSSKETALHNLLEFASEEDDVVVEKFFELIEKKQNKKKSLLDTSLLNRKGETALHVAIEKGNFPAVKYLLNTTHPSIKNKYGLTPKEYAAAQGDDMQHPDRLKINELFGIEKK